MDMAHLSWVLRVGECGSEIRNTRSPVPNKDAPYP